MTGKSNAKPKRIDHEGYGKTKILSIEKVSSGKSTSIKAVCKGEDFDGLKVEACHMGEILNYYVTESWINGGGVRIDVAYRIFEESEKYMSVGLVRNYSELERIKTGIQLLILRVTNRLK